MALGRKCGASSVETVTEVVDGPRGGEGHLSLMQASKIGSFVAPSRDIDCDSPGHCTELTMMTTAIIKLSLYVLLEILIFVK